MSVYEEGEYHVTVTKSDMIGSGKSAEYRVKAGPFGQNRNFIVKTSVEVANILTKSLVDSLPNQSRTQIIQYYDGLGRPIQSVQTQQSPDAKDIVQPFVYDSLGREPIKFLPYVSGNDGWYKANPVIGTASYTGSPHQTFWTETNNLIARDSFPYAVTILEPSPLNRVVKQGAPGSVWQPNTDSSYNSTDHTLKMKYAFNDASEVLLWTFTEPNEQYSKTATNAFGKVNAGTVTSPIYYAADQLYKNMSKDEHGNQVINYSDKQGRTILKRVQAKPGTPPATTGANKDSDYASTYYIYNNFGDLICVIPPEATKKLASEYFHSESNDASKNSFLMRWAFRYRYDGRGRTIMKHTPGAEPIYLVYDKRDRVVLSQDGNQRTDGSGNITKKEWSFTKYDVLNRPVMTGIYTHGTVVNHGAVVALIDTVTFAENYDDTKPHGYTTNIFPSTGLTVHTVTFYDNYNFRDDLITGDAYDFIDNHLSGQRTTYFDKLKGQVTGTKVNVLGTGDYLWSVHYFDDRYRVIQSVAQNHLDSLDRITNIYDFAGRVLKTKTSHITSNESIAVTRDLTYDHAGRLLRVYHKINNEDSVLLSENSYNDLGELVTKKLHSRNETDFSQNLDFRYTIRGWIKSINDPNINPNALFNYQLKYNDPTANGGDQQFNGNISQTIWKTAGSDESSYGFYYDPMSRLEQALYFSHNKAEENGRYNEVIKDGSSSGYDLNGNIKKLQRYGQLTATTWGLMDNLSYTYTNASGFETNQLTIVNDAIATQTHEKGFKELIETTDEYTYDANGNMVKDQNKGITAITYNHLNLPVQVSKGVTNYIVYTYDATGRKLKQQVYGATPKTTDYAGEFIYENDTLRFINHEEGRILPDTSSTAQHPWEYQYHLKDHLGNVRVTFSEKTTTDEYLATMEKDPSTIDTLENNMFLNMVSSKKIAFYNHTPNAQTGYSYRLSASSTELIGPAKSFEVNSGDVVDLEVYVRYSNLTTTNSGLSNLFNSLVGAFSLNPSGGVGLEGQQAHSAFNSMFGSGAFIGSDDWDENAPKAYLNYILFDEDFNLVDFGFDQLSQSAGTAHEMLSLHVKVQQKGYLYIYLSNENDKIVDVYFDDFKIVHHTGVEQLDSYYPFGLTFNSFLKENSTKNNLLYNGKELQDELDLGWLDYGARMYMSDIGRWGVSDPLAELMRRHSPYNYAFNNPVRFIDPDGMTPLVPRGADGLTNDQWIEASRPGNNFFEMSRSFREQNRAEESANMRKKATVKVGEVGYLGEDREGGGEGGEGSTQGCDDCPGFWHNYKEGWKSLVWNFKRMLKRFPGTGISLKPRVGIHISGDDSGMENYALKYMEAMGIEGQLDLSKEDNIFKLLNYLTTSNELDAVDKILLAYNSNPLNKSYKGVPLWWESEYSGYYVSFWGGPDHPYVYERVKTGSGYRMEGVLKSSLEKRN